MNLSKAYDCLPHDFIIAKFEISHLSKTSLMLLLDCLEGQKQCVKIGSLQSFWSDVKRGVLQGSILGPLLFNVFIKDLLILLENCETCNFADGNTLYSRGMGFCGILENLKRNMKSRIAIQSKYHEKVIQNKFTKANRGKFQVMILGKKQSNKVKLKVNSVVINEKDTVKLLGITFDNKLIFIEHINNLCCNASYELYVLRRIKKYLTQDRQLSGCFLRRINI